MKKLLSFTFYFLYFASLAATIPYLVLFYKHQGFSGWQIGILTSLGPLASLVGSLGLTSFADATRQHRLVMLISGLVAIGVILLFPITTQFPVMMLLVLLYSIAFAPVISLADSATMYMLGTEQSLYGRVRVGGTIGWGLFAPLIGIMIDRWGINWIFAVYAVGLFLAIILGMFFKHSPSPTKREPFLKGIKILLSNPDWVFFLQMAFIGGVGMTVIHTYQSLYLESLGVSKSIIGLSQLVTTISEVPILFFGNYLLKKFNPKGLLLIAIGVISVRLLMVAWTNNPTAIILLGLLHGLTFPTLWLAGVSFAHKNAPQGMAATAQGIFGSVLTSFGVASGSLLGGLLMELLGIRTMFVVLGLAVLLAMLVLAALQVQIERKKALEAATTPPESV